MMNHIFNKKAIILACVLVMNTSLVFSEENYEFEEYTPEIYFHTAPQGQVIEDQKSSVKLWNNKSSSKKEILVKNQQPQMSNEENLVEEISKNEFKIENKKNFDIKSLNPFKSNQSGDVKNDEILVKEQELNIEPQKIKKVSLKKGVVKSDATKLEEFDNLREEANFNSAVDDFFEEQSPQAIQITQEKNLQKECKSENLEANDEEFSPLKNNNEFIKQKLQEEEFEPQKIKKINKKQKNIDKRLTDIQKQIEKEDLFKHDTTNNVYLDKYNTILDEKSNTFYSEKNIEENENGQLQLTTEDDKPSIYELIKTIENSNPDNVFEPPVKISLRDCIGIAIAKHPSVISAQINTEIYKSRIVQAWAAYFPNFSAGFDYSYMHSKVPDYSYGMHSAYFPNASAGLLLFDFGKTKTQADIAKVDYSASKFDLQNSINDIVFSVKSAYYNLLFAQKQVEVYKRTIEQFELHLQSAQKYFSIGKKPQVDVAIAEYNVGSAKLNLVKAMNTLEVAKINLANTLGLPEFANFELSDDLEKYDYSTDLEILLQDAFTIRPDLLSYQKMVESSLLNVRSARRGFTPDLTANSSFYRGGADPMKETNYNVSVNLSYSGMNLLQLKKEYDIAKKSYEKSLSDYEQKRQSVYLEVKEAFINLNNSKETVKQAELNVGQAKAQHYHATGRYKAGLGDAIELKDSENTYMNAQLEFYQSLLDYNNDIANLERVVGRPIEVTKSKL